MPYRDDLEAALARVAMLESELAALKPQTVAPGDSQLDQAELLYARKDWDGAFKAYQTILVHQHGSLGPRQSSEIFHRLGNIMLRRGDREKACNMFEKALELADEDARQRKGQSK